MHGLSCPLPTPRSHSNSHPSSQWQWHVGSSQISSWTVSPSLPDGFLTSWPPGKPLHFLMFPIIHCCKNDAPTIVNNKKHIYCCLNDARASLVAQMVQNPPAMQETCVQSLGGQDPPEKGMATHFSILAWRIPWTEETGGLQSMVSQRVGDDWANYTRMNDAQKEMVYLYLGFLQSSWHYDMYLSLKTLES